MEDKGNRSFHVGLSKDATRKLTRPSGPPRIGILRAAIGGRALSVGSGDIHPPSNVSTQDNATVFHQGPI